MLIRIAEADHPAEAVEEPPDLPAHERDRDEDHHAATASSPRTASAISLVAVLGRLPRGLALLLHVAEDVLVDHDRVVDDDADGEDQAEHRDVVEREAHHVHERERADHRRRDRQRRDQRRPPVADEQQDRQADQDGRQEQVDA